jgi:EpsI family protein
MDSVKTGFLRSKSALILTVVLLVQAAVFYSLSHGESVPMAHPLVEFPRQFGDWQLAQEGVIEREVQDVLRADDTVSRLYVNANKTEVASFFVAYFKSQRTGQAPHSPKNCLPGAGWVPSRSGYLKVKVPAQAEPIEVNRYVVSRGDEKSVVLYWYQTSRRVIASEYEAKLWLVLDAIRYNRTDTAMVRVVVPGQRKTDEEATAVAAQFIQDLFQPLRKFLPS